MVAGALIPDCAGDLATCETQPTGQERETGQTLCYDNFGTEISCTGTGQDGEFLKGVANSFTDNGNGTVTDNQTGLMWEKLSDNGDIHDQDTTYDWTTAVWSSSTYQLVPVNAWVVNFSDGDTSANLKFNSRSVRAVGAGVQVGYSIIGVLIIGGSGA